MSPAQEERDAVVAWLRDQRPTDFGTIFQRIHFAWDWLFDPQVAMMTGLWVAAKAIERGDHIEAKP